MPNIAFGTLLLLLLCVISGRPQVFADTKAYFALGQEVASTVFPARPQEASVALRGVPLAPAKAVVETRLAYTVAASRSPYWSVWFYALVRLGTAWLFVAAQALLAAATLWVAARGFGVAPAYLPIVAVLAFASSLPVFVLFLMPDLFAGLSILAAAVLAFRGDMLRRRETIGLWLVMAAGAASHVSHLLMLGGLGVVVLGMAVRRNDRQGRRGALLMIAAAATGAIGAVAFPLAVRAIRHEPVYAPPFVAARLIADGPGRDLLRDDCRTGREWGWCRFRRRPLGDVNQILWSKDPRDAVFQAAGYDERVRIIGEQSRFVLAVVTRYPATVAGVVWSNIWHLAGQYGTGEVLDDPARQYRDPAFSIFTRIVPGTEACRAGRASCASRIDIALLDAVIGLTLVASIVAILILLARQPGRRRIWLPTVLFMAAAMLVNALICGGLSGNAQRYQSRVTWLLPTLALFMVADRRKSASARQRSPA